MERVLSDVDAVVATASDEILMGALGRSKAGRLGYARAVAPPSPCPEPMAAKSKNVGMFAPYAYRRDIDSFRRISRCETAERPDRRMQNDHVLLNAVPIG